MTASFENSRRLVRAQKRRGDFEAEFNSVDESAEYLSSQIANTWTRSRRITPVTHPGIAPPPVARRRPARSLKVRFSAATTILLLYHCSVRAAGSSYLE
jgi:hypothetical protein